MVEKKGKETGKEAPGGERRSGGPIRRHRKFATKNNESRAHPNKVVLHQFLACWKLQRRFVSSGNPSGGEHFWGIGVPIQLP